MLPTRRTMVAASLASPLAAAVVPAEAAAAPGWEAAERALTFYVGQGGKASGGPGDLAVGAWMEEHLRAVGFRTERQRFDAPFFDVGEASLTAGDATATVIPQAIVVTTSPKGVEGRLLHRSPWDAGQPCAGAIVLMQLPYSRWSTAASEAVRKPVGAAIAAGAAAVVLVTTGPSGEALALNAEGSEPMFERPVAVLAPRDAAPFFKAAAAGRSARLKITGAGGRRETFNLIGRLDRGHARWLVVSTPRSGWFTCAGERGAGVAVWTLLADWAAKASLPVNLAFVCNSGHEYENLGATRLLDAAAPPPSTTAFWLHLGANVAARDWHEAGPRMEPLPSPDPQRFLLATPALLPACRTAFAGQVGLEAPYPLGAGAAGELTHIVAAGYPKVAGVFGAHRFHHARADDARCVLVAPVIAATRACQDLIKAAIALG